MSLSCKESDCLAATEAPRDKKVVRGGRGFPFSAAPNLISEVRKLELWAKEFSMDYRT